MWQAWLIGVVVVAVIIYSIVQGIKIINPPEMGILVIFGKPVSFWDSGFHFSPLLVLGRLLGCYVAMFPKDRFNLNYKAKEVITKEGFYPKDEDEYPKGTKRYYGSQVLTVDPTVYLTLPRKKRKINGVEEREHPLFEIFRSKVPTDQKGLLNWTGEAVSSALRVAFGDITWREAVEKLYILRKKADEEFRDSDGALVRAGFGPKDIELTVPEIFLPPDLEKILPLYDKQRIEAEAARFEAIERAIETAGAVMESFCAQTGMSLEEAQGKLKEDNEKFIQEYKDPWERSWDVIHRRMGIDGRQYFDLRVLGGTKLEGFIPLFKKILGTGGEKKEGEEKKDKLRDIIERAKKI